MLLNRWSRSSFHMEELLHHLLSMEPYEKWDILRMNWCRISSITLDFDILFSLFVLGNDKIIWLNKTIFTNTKEHSNQQPKRRHGLTIVCFSWRSSGVCVVARSRQSLMQGNCLLSYLCFRCCALEICKKTAHDIFFYPHHHYGFDSIKMLKLVLKTMKC